MVEQINNKREAYDQTTTNRLLKQKISTQWTANEAQKNTNISELVRLLQVIISGTISAL